MWVPDGAQEALRYLTRTREDMKHLQRQAKQRLLTFMLRQGQCYSGKGLLDAGALSLAGGGEIRATGTADRVPGISPYGQGDERVDGAPKLSTITDTDSSGYFVYELAFFEAIIHTG